MRWIAGVVVDVPIDVGAGDARDAAARELSDPAYAAARPSLVERVLTWLGDRLGGLFRVVGAVGPLGWFALLILAALAVLLVVVIRARIGPMARSAARRGANGVFDAVARTARDHRLAAERAFAEGRLADAVRERFRAIARELEERGVIDERSGRTADEVAADAGRAAPTLAGPLGAAARIFDDVHYGERGATVAGYQLLAGVDAQVGGSRAMPA